MNFSPFLTIVGLTFLVNVAFSKSLSDEERKAVFSWYSKTTNKIQNEKKYPYDIFNDLEKNLVYQCSTRKAFEFLESKKRVEPNNKNNDLDYFDKASVFKKILKTCINKTLKENIKPLKYTHVTQKLKSSYSDQELHELKRGRVILPCKYYHYSNCPQHCKIDCISSGEDLEDCDGPKSCYQNKNICYSNLDCNKNQLCSNQLKKCKGTYYFEKCIGKCVSK